MIRIHLIRSIEVDKETLQGVQNYLAAFPGVLQFQVHEHGFQIGRYVNYNRAMDTEMLSDNYVTEEKSESIFFQGGNKDGLGTCGGVFVGDVQIKDQDNEKIKQDIISLFNF